MTTLRIDSRRHDLVSRFRALATEADAAGRRLLLDGVHLVREARAAALPFEVVVVATSASSPETEVGHLAASLRESGVDVVEASDRAFDALSPVRAPSGIAAIVERPAAGAADLYAVPTPLIVVAIDVQDPGNVGAVIRAAEAGGATGVLVCGASASPFSWKAVRGSMGSVLRLPVAGGPSPDDLLAELSAAGVRSVATTARGGLDPDRVSWRGRVALLLGAEGSGLMPDLAGACDQRVSIPMAPPVDSLNVAVAGAIVIYAARRQRA
jgi:TrmH family RNA methyltransferase